MCKYVCICVSVCLCMYLYVYLCIYVSMCLCIYVSLHLYIFVSMYICIYASMCLCIHLYMCFCVALCLDISRIQSQIMHTRNPITNQSQNFVIGRLGVLNDVIEFCFMKLSVASPCCPTINVCEFCVVLQIHRQIGGCR